MSDMAPEQVHARLTPYELVFGFEDFEAERFPAIRAEARARGAGEEGPGAFLQLTAVGALVRELLPEDAAAAALPQVGRLLYHAYQFWRFGKQLVVVEDGLLRALLAGVAPVGAWELTPPHPAGYLQLPRNRMWARADESVPAEPVDGFFWSMVGEADPATPPYRRLDVLLALGVRPERPGFSVMGVSADTGGAPGHWADVRGREEGTGADFSNVLPGGELSGLFALATEAEVLKLVSLLFLHVARQPQALEAHAADPAATRPAGVALSALPFELLRDVPGRG